MVVKFRWVWLIFVGMLIIGTGSILIADEDPIVVKMGKEVIRQSELKSLIDEVRAQDNETLNTVLERKQFLENIIDQRHELCRLAALIRTPM